jgi:hypothetical protein
MRNTNGLDRTAQLSLLMFAAMLIGCALEAVDPETPGLNTQALSTVAQTDFENQAVGPLGAPWVVSPAGTSRVSVIATQDHGQVALLHGGTTNADFVSASLALASSADLIRLGFDVNPAPGAAFIFALHGAGSSIGARRIRLGVEPTSNVLTATTTSGNLACGALVSGVWSRVTLSVRTKTHDFDVLINGQASACSRASTAIGVPFNAVSLMDASNEGYGGDVRFDNVAVVADASPPCTPPPTPSVSVLDSNFDGDPLGAPRAPWSITPASGRSTVAIVNATNHGRALQLHGSTRSGDTVIAARAFSSSQVDIEFDFTIRPDNGAAFIVALNGAGGSIGARRIRLQRSPGSSTLVASTSGVGNLNCGTLPSNAWSSIALTVHTQDSPHTFDVHIDGEPSACNGTATEMGAPFTGINVMDASNDGYGGDVLFDDLLVTASGAPRGSCP